MATSTIIATVFEKKFGIYLMERSHRDGPTSKQDIDVLAAKFFHTLYPRHNFFDLKCQRQELWSRAMAEFIYTMRKAKASK